MLPKRALIVLLIATFLALAGLLLVRGFQSPTTASIQGCYLYTLPINKVTTYTLQVNGQPKIELVKKLGIWTFKTPYPELLCNQAAVTTLLQKALSATAIALLPDNQAPINPATAITLSLSTIDQTEHCTLGFDLPILANERCVQKGNLLLTSQAKYFAEIPQDPQALLDLANQLRAQTIWPLTSSTSITEFERRKTAYPVVRIALSDDKRWFINQPLTYPLMTKQVDALITSLTTTPIIDYILPSQTTPKAKLSTTNLAQYGLDEENADRLQILTPTSKLPIEIRLGNDVPGKPSQTYALLDHERAIVTIDSSLKTLIASPDGLFSLKNRPVFNFTPEHVSSLSIAKRDQTILLKYDSPEWHLSLPFSHMADRTSVESCLQALASLTLESLLSTQQPIIETNRIAQVTLKHKSQSIPPSPDIQFALYTTQDDPAHYLLKTQSSPLVFRVKATLFPSIITQNNLDVDLLSKTLISASPTTIQRVTLSYPNQPKIILVKGSANNWYTQSPQGEFFDQALLQDWLQAYSTIKAARIIGLATPLQTDLAKYGLDTPSQVISLDFNAGPLLRQTILFGKTSSATGETPIMLRGQQIIYSLSAEDSAKFFKQLIIPSPSTP